MPGSPSAIPSVLIHSVVYCETAVTGLQHDLESRHSSLYRIQMRLSNFYLRRPDWHHVPSLGSNHKKLLTSSSLALANNGVARGEAATNTNQRCCS